MYSRFQTKQITYIGFFISHIPFLNILSLPSKRPVLLHGTAAQLQPGLRHSPRLHLFPLALCPPFSQSVFCFLFSLFTSLSVSPPLYVYISLSLPCCPLMSLSLSVSSPHTHRKELSSVGPLLLHYVNHHFPSTAASFLSRLHFPSQNANPCQTLPLYVCIPLHV